MPTAPPAMRPMRRKVIVERELETVTCRVLLELELFESVTVMVTEKAPVPENV